MPKSLICLTRPDGGEIWLAPAFIALVREVLTGEYPPSAQTVLAVGGDKIAVRENIETVVHTLTEDDFG